MKLRVIVTMLGLLAACNDTPDLKQKPPIVNEGFNKAELAVPDLSLGVVENFKIGDQLIYYTRISSLNIFEGDIILTDAQIQKLGSSNGKLNSAPSSNTFLRWANSRIPYTIVNTSRSIDILSAISTIEANSNIDFIPRTNEANYVSFINGDGCSSYVGMIGGNQNITIGPFCPVGSIIHEICHAIGIWHEQSRPDRDNFVLINYQNIETGQGFNFDKISTALNYGPFDIGSIMMYGSFAFSTGGPTITRLDGSTFTANRNNLTLTDAQCITDLYPPRVLNLDAIDVGANSSGTIYYIKAVLRQGNKVYSSNGTNLGGNSPTRLTVHPNGNPYVIASNSQVQYYSNGKWISLGKPGGSSPLVTTVDIAAGSDGSIYALSSTSNSTGSSSKLFKYSNSVWPEVLGCPKADRVSIQGDGTIWVLSQGLGNINRYVGGSWINVSKPTGNTIANLVDLGISGNSVYLIASFQNGARQVYRYTQNLVGWLQQRIDTSVDTCIASGLNGEIVI